MSKFGDLLGGKTPATTPAPAAAPAPVAPPAPPLIKEEPKQQGWGKPNLKAGKK
jgi:hypothetical protein